MTDREKKVMDHLTEAHREFILLDQEEKQHFMDLQEWVYKMHDLQRIIMARAAVREDPETFPIKK